MLVLAVEGQQRHGHVAQVPHGRRAPAQVRPRAALRADAPGEHDLLRVGGQALAELAAQRGRQLEHALHVGLGGARAHDAGAGPAAEQQIERVGEHGLARTGLPREHVQARGQAQLGPLDEQKVLDTQL